MIPALFSSIVAFILFSFVDYQDISHPLLVGPFSDGSLWGSEAVYGNFDYTFEEALLSGAIDEFFLSGSSLYNPVLWTMKIELIGSFLIYLLCATVAIGVSHRTEPRGTLEYKR